MGDAAAVPPPQKLAGKVTVIAGDNVRGGYD